MKILSLGAGVQSTCLYLMAVKGELHIDCAVFADLGDEPSPVYRHLEWLKTLSGPQIHTVTAGKLGDHLIQGINSTGGRFASIPAWTAAKAGEPLGKIRRQCTKEYKIEPIERFIRRTLFGLEPGRHFPKGTQINQLFGISLDEAARAWRIKSNAPAWCSPVFPLIDRMMTRSDCLKWLDLFGIPHSVPRSACVFCPYKSDHEWVWLRENDPSGFNRAIEIDEGLRKPGAVVNRNLDEMLYLHPTARPLREVALTDKERGQGEFSYECEGGCGL
jgi:hypothetical protein